MESQGFSIVENTYEEYLLDELAERDPNRFIMRVMIGMA